MYKFNRDDARRFAREQESGLRLLEMNYVLETVLIADPQKIKILLQSI